jgi:hypothetical protein
MTSRADCARWLNERIAYCRANLLLIDKAFAEELAKPIFERQRENFVFLDKERSVYAFAMNELQAALEMIDNGKEK